ncbi:MAG: aspartate carbamoyltransferase [Leptonema sp. (in: bacteria)]
MKYEFPHKHIIDPDQFSLKDLETILLATEHIVQLQKQNRIQNILKNYLMASLFFESSTRTRLSFETAMLRLGGMVISTVGFQFSSISKGETLYDTMKMIEAYADIAVIRHPVEGSSKLAASAVDIPIINAGDGTGHHPTQALLDLYTIYKEKKTIDNLQIAFIGDLKFGRTIHSLVKLLSLYKVKMIFISPVDLAIPEMYRKDLRKKGIEFKETEDLRALWDCDVAYVTRIQEERFVDKEEYERLKSSYIVNRELVLASKKNTLIMHPLPRVNELSTDVDSLPNAVYFKQAKYGVDVRMALLCLCLNVELPDL